MDHRDSIPIGHDLVVILLGAIQLNVQIANVNDSYATWHQTNLWNVHEGNEVPNPWSRPYWVNSDRVIVIPT